MTRWVKILTRFFLFLLVVGIGMNSVSTFAASMNYPERDITVIVPYKPGGGGDLIVRGMSPYMKMYLPKQVNWIIQNIDAAGGRVGTFQAYDAKPDGYTIGLLENFAFPVAEVLGETGGRISTKMTWLSKLSSTPFMLAVSSNSGIKTIQDLKGKKVRAATAQATLPTTVAMLKFLGADPYIVMYGGGSECALATLRGDTEVMVGIPATILRQAEASRGKLIPLAILGEKRFADAPNVPSLKELGVTLSPDMLFFNDYYYMLAGPPSLPSEVSKILIGAIEKTLKDQRFVEELAKAKIEVSYAPAKQVKESMSLLPGLLARYKESIRQAVGK